MKKLDRIKKLALKRGTPLVDFISRDRHTIFKYKTLSGLKWYSYSSTNSAVDKELKRLSG